MGTNILVALVLFLAFVTIPVSIIGLAVYAVLRRRIKDWLFVLCGATVILLITLAIIPEGTFSTTSHKEEEVSVTVPSDEKQNNEENPAEKDLVESTKQEPAEEVTNQTVAQEPPETVTNPPETVTNPTETVTNPPEEPETIATEEPTDPVVENANPTSEEAEADESNDEEYEPRGTGGDGEHQRVEVNYMETQTDEPTVFITRGKGKRYHLDPNCEGLEYAWNIDEVTLSKAQEKGKTPCKLCAR